MRPTVGIEGVCPPLCTMNEINNGTYTLAEIEEMNQAMHEMLEESIRAIESSRT